MKSLLLCIAFLAVLHPAFAQYTEPDCGWYGNKTVEERNALFPFNKAKKVVLVSYLAVFGRGSNVVDTLETMKKHGAIKRVDFDFGKYHKRTYLIKEEIVLTQNWINQLSNVLINYTFKEPPETLGRYASLCYEPRNAILFYDEAGGIICCYEVCFECGGTVLMPDPDNVNANALDCQYEKEKEIKVIFSKNGITYGVGKE